MVREYLRDVSELRRVHEETPPEDVEEDEEDGGAEARDVSTVRVEKGCR